MRRYGLMLLTVGLLLGNTAGGQTSDIAELVSQANGLTKTAITTEEYKQILQICEQIDAARPSQANADYSRKLSAWAHNRIGEVYVKNAGKVTGEKGREYDKQALQHFEAAVKKDATHWKARHNRGVSYGLVRRYEDAVTDFSVAIKKKPDYLNSWFNRAEIYYELGKYDRAVSDYSHVLKTSPKDVAARVQRAHSQFRLGRVSKALSDYDQAIKYDSNRADLFVFRGDSHQALGSWGKASLDYRQAIKIDENNAHAFRSSAWLMATCPDEEFRRGERAVDAAERAMKLYGQGDYRTLDALAAAHANAGNYTRAVQVIAQALTKAPRKSLEALVRRQRLYEGQQPFRQSTRVAAKPKTSR